MWKQWKVISIERLFEKIKYGSYPQNADFYDLPIEYKETLFKERPIYCLTNNKVERLKVSSIEGSIDNRKYESSPQNDNFYDLPFDGDERLIAKDYYII